MELLSNRNMSEIIKKMLICVFALGGLISSSIVYAQLPDLPVLSFNVRTSTAYSGRDNNFTDWWPDHRIWTVPSRQGMVQELLVPVFIENRWYNFQNKSYMKFKEISSFSFRVYYDNNILEFLDVQKHHPFTEEEAINLRSTHFYASGQMEYYKPLAYNFNLVASNETATDFYKYFNIDDATTRNGKAVTVSGTASSFHNLPTTPANEYRVLLYLKFRVIPTTTNASGVGTGARTGKIYFDPTYICYNGVNIARDRGNKLLEDYPILTDVNYNAYLSDFRDSRIPRGEANDNIAYFDPTWTDAKKNSEVQAKSVGIQKYGNYIAQSNYTGVNKYNNEPYLPGSMTVSVMNFYPAFTFDVIDNKSILFPEYRRISLDVNGSDSSKWVMTEPITADNLASQRPSYYNHSERAIVIGTTPDTVGKINFDNTVLRVMENIIIESDQPWLRFRAEPFYDQAYVSSGVNANYENKLGQNVSMLNPVRRGFVQRINNLIRQENTTNPLNFESTSPMPVRFVLWVDCDQTGLPAGEYIGNITLKSPFDRYENTSIQIKFVVIESPVEKPTTVNNSSEIPYGIKLEITPFNGTRTDLTRTLIMGSSPLATDGIDSLCGEYVHPQPLLFDRFGSPLTFDARFFLDPNAYPEANFVDKSKWRALVDTGFGDYTHHDGVNNTGTSSVDNKTPRAHSRDIRTSLPTNQSNVHYVKFKHTDQNVDFYPVVLRWDASQFPDANTIHLKYLLSGVEYILDMRDEKTSTFTFLDKSVQEFWIEYTVGQSSESDLKDNWGEDIIQPNAWNFVSLPLNPVNKYYKYVFPNAITLPYFFSQNMWGNPPNGDLQPGIGYFVKYQNIVDKRFYGAYFYNINENTYPVPLWGTEKEGWNSIGALSTIISVNDVSFGQFTGEMADINFTKNQGFWGYRPNRGYAEVSHLYPGKGYFIKVNRNAYLRMSTGGKSIFELPSALPNRVAGFDKINVADASQNIGSVYAGNNIDITQYGLPPVPPSMMFDVRYSRDNYVANYGDDAIVNMQGITYPVTINFDNPRANYTITDPVSGAVYGTVKAGTNDNVVINYSKSNSFKLTAEASNETFFINVNNNPVNTNYAEISFGIDNDAYVSINVFNAIGNEVAKIEAEQLSKGVYNKTINVANLPSGVYSVRMIANGETKVFMMNIIK